MPSSDFGLSRLRGQSRSGLGLECTTPGHKSQPTVSLYARTSTTSAAAVSRGEWVLAIPLRPTESDSARKVTRLARPSGATTVQKEDFKLASERGPSHKAPPEVLECSAALPSTPLPVPLPRLDETRNANTIGHVSAADFMDGPDETDGLQTFACALVGRPSAFHPPPTTSRLLAGSSAVTTSASAASSAASLPPPTVLMQQLQQHRPPQIGRTTRRAFLARSTDNCALATGPDLCDDCGGQSSDVFLPDFSSFILSAQSQQFVTPTHAALGRCPTRPVSQLAGAMCTTASLDTCGGGGAGGSVAGFAVAASTYNRSPGAGAIAVEAGGSLPQLQLPARMSGAAPRAPALSSSTVLPSMPSRSACQPSVGGCSPLLVASAATAASSQQSRPAQSHVNAGASLPVAPVSSSSMAVARGHSSRGSRLGGATAITSAAMSLLTVATPGSAGTAGAVDSGRSVRTRDSSASVRLPCSLPLYAGASANAVSSVSPAFGASPAGSPAAALAAAATAAAGAAATRLTSLSLRSSGIAMEVADYAGAQGQDAGHSALRASPGGRAPLVNSIADDATIGKGGSGPALKAKAEEAQDFSGLCVGSCWSDGGLAACDAPDSTFMRRGARASLPCFPAPSLPASVVANRGVSCAGAGLAMEEVTRLAVKTAATEAAVLRKDAAVGAASIASISPLQLYQTSAIAAAQSSTEFSVALGWGTETAKGVGADDGVFRPLPVLPKVPAVAALADPGASPFATAAAFLSMPPPSNTPPVLMAGIAPGLVAVRKAAAAADALRGVQAAAAFSPFAAAASDVQHCSASQQQQPCSTQPPPLAAFESDLAFDSLCERSDLEITPSFGYPASSVIRAGSGASQPLQQLPTKAAGQPMPGTASMYDPSLLAEQQQ